jgi:blue light- and temperature-responsive anti-repressor
MTKDVYRILYCSRNDIQNSLDHQLAEIRKILVSARANNAACGITGALLFNAGCFAQVLEGPLQEVEATFEKIQRDLRHTDVTVLEACSVAQREFPDWSMAFSGSAQGDSAAFAEFTLDGAFANPSAAAAEIHGMLSTLVLQEDDFVADTSIRLV